MKHLLIRNIKLRKWTIIIYIFLLLISPLQLIIENNSIYTKVIYSTVAMLLLFVSVLDSGHVFRLNAKLGHPMAYDFFGSLPVSKRDMLNANYVTMIIFTLVGAAILSLFNIPNSNVAASEINFNLTLPYSYIAINFFAIPIAFKRYSEQKTEYISYLMYLLAMLILIPIVAVLMALAVVSIFKVQLTILDYVEPAFNYGFLALSIIFLAMNYWIQFKRLLKK
ncbi:phenol-soluble modulin export ABC transporter permease subunit PmtB [Staphylococcus caeli]|uniref:phenol-soluble modulin export ABC transporter permease subunit PmtB n=1 Tax=Staphylococcus caeli TaxID=2201815 RepID=UPI003F5652F0